MLSGEDIETHAAFHGANDGGVVIEDTDEETIRVMLSTDNHLGYLEGDAVRGDDSFAALEEMLYLAKYYACDLVLLAGDLFHENKPSRRTLHKAMTIFRKYCMGPNPISIQIISDQSRTFRQGQVNYQSEYYSVDLPVMSIHGNHDDPSREGVELYAALDLLDCASLVNYIGRQDQINQIEVAPVLIKKGSTHLALYALGSMRDERLNRMWQTSNVTFLRPSPDASDDKDAPEFFNLFALHQNRDKGRGNKNCVHEAMIPEWMDLVCWGHEHECCIEPQESVVGTFRITQPGSSVATSLVVGEAAIKHVGLLDIRGQSFRLRPIPLTQVRTFVVGEISLQEQRNLDPDDPKVEERTKKVLQEQVDLLIHQAKRKRRQLLRTAGQQANIVAQMEEFPLSNQMRNQDEVLVRLKVEHSGFSALNNQRFGAQFIGQVANPTDILLFQRKKAAVARAVSTKATADPVVPEQLEEMNIEDFIFGELDGTSDRKLELLDDKRIGSALVNYVQKQDAQAIPEAVSTLLGKQQKMLIRGGNSKEAFANSNIGERGIEIGRVSDDSRNRRDRQLITPGNSSKIARQKGNEKTRSKSTINRSRSDSDSEADEVADNPPKKTKKSRTIPIDPSHGEESDKDLEENGQQERNKIARPRRAVALKTSYGFDSAESEDDEEPNNNDSHGKRKPRKRERLSSETKSRRSQGLLLFTATKPAPTAKRARRRYGGTLDSDDEEKDKGSTFELEEDWGAVSTNTFTVSET